MHVVSDYHLDASKAQIPSKYLLVDLFWLFSCKLCFRLILSYLSQRLIPFSNVLNDQPSDQF